MVVIMIAAFSLAWLPYAAFAMYNAFNPEHQVGVSIIVSKISALMFCKPSDRWLLMFCNI